MKTTDVFRKRPYDIVVRKLSENAFERVTPLKNRYFRHENDIKFYGALKVVFFVSAAHCILESARTYLKIKHDHNVFFTLFRPPTSIIL